MLVIRAKTVVGVSSGSAAYTENAGASWRTIFKGIGPLPGFALSSDGTRVFLGGPKDGIQVAATADFQFTQKTQIEVQCLFLAPDGLWACSNEKRSASFE